MDLEGILAIGGKPGLYKLVAQGRNGIIVESISEPKRFPVSQAGNVSALKDIAIYTADEEVPLVEVFEKIAAKENYGACISHKEPVKDLETYLEEVLPDYDRERVYPSDLKKLFAWYNLLQQHGLITEGEAEEAQSDEETGGEEE